MTIEEEPQRLRERVAQRDPRIQQKETQLCQQDLLMQQMEAQIAALTQQVKDLQDRLAKDSHNSSLPPSSDRFVRQPKSLEYPSHLMQIRSIVSAKHNTSHSSRLFGLFFVRSGAGFETYEHIVSSVKTDSTLGSLSIFP